MLFVTIITTVAVLIGSAFLYKKNEKPVKREEIIIIDEEVKKVDDLLFVGKNSKFNLIFSYITLIIELILAIMMTEMMISQDLAGDMVKGENVDEEGEGEEEDELSERESKKTIIIKKIAVEKQEDGDDKKEEPKDIKKNPFFYYSLTLKFLFFFWLFFFFALYHFAISLVEATIIQLLNVKEKSFFNLLKTFFLGIIKKDFWKILLLTFLKPLWWRKRKINKMVSLFIATFFVFFSEYQCLEKRILKPFSMSKDDDEDKNDEENKENLIEEQETVRLTDTTNGKSIPIYTNGKPVITDNDLNPDNFVDNGDRIPDLNNNDQHDGYQEEPQDLNQGEGQGAGEERKEEEQQELNQEGGEGQGEGEEEKKEEEIFETKLPEGEENKDNKK